MTTHSAIFTSRDIMMTWVRPKMIVDDNLVKADSAKIVGMTHCKHIS